LKSSFQVFLSHSSADKPAVEEISRRLLKEGIEAWLDKWHLIPGDPWQPAIENALAESETCAVFVGPGGFGPWQNEEMRAAIDRRVRDSNRRFRVIPVLLPGAQRAERGSLPSFLAATTWVEFRDSLDDQDAFHRLVSGIRGVEPGAGPGNAIYEGKCPYRGLRVFDVDDTAFFFGREALVQWLLNELQPATAGQQANRFLAIVGSSGSGKSSVARAGLVAALKRDAIAGSSGWPVAICRPGPDPLESLAVALSKVLNIGPGISALAELVAAFRQSEKTLHLLARRSLPENPGTRLIVLVDQFEEIFTLCHDDALRDALVSNLLYAAKVVQGQTIVILTMRADFYGKCAGIADLAAALSDHNFLVGPMTDDELRRAIERPAQLAGCEFDAGLVDLLEQDVRNQPGALPLLQHALLELWNHREGRRLTVKGYQEVGKLEGALQRRADATLEPLSADEREFCRRIFLRLTQPGEGTEDTKRRVSMQELLSLSDETAAEEEIIQKLADASLLTTEGDVTRKDAFVEVAHEALIRSWPQLRKWIDVDRSGFRTRTRLTEATSDWENSGCDAAYLYAGARLAVAEEWAGLHPGDLSAGEAEFLRRSAAAQKEREANELEAAQRLARAEAERAQEAEKRVQEQKQASSRLRRRAFAAVGAAVIALVLLGVSIVMWRAARRQARIAIAQRTAAEEQARIANTQRLAAQSSEKSANDAREQADGLINFMLSDLSNKLRPIGRLDLLYDVALSAKKYLDGLPKELVTVVRLRQESATLNELGDVLSAQGKLQEALEVYKQGLAIKKSLTDQDKSDQGRLRDFAQSFEKVGDVLVAQGKLQEALETYEQQLTIAQQLSEQSQSNNGLKANLSESYINVGDVLRKQGKLQDAMGAYQQSLAIAKSLTERDKSNPVWQRAFGVSNQRVGEVLVRQGKLQEALDAYQQNLDIQQRLIDRDKTNASWKRDLALSYENVGDVLSAQGKLQEALDAYRQGLAIAQRLTVRDESNSLWQRDFGVSNQRVGEVLVRQGKLQEALDAYQQNLEIQRTLTDRDKTNAGSERDLALSYENVGDVLSAQGKLQEALDAYRQTLAIVQRLTVQDKSNSDWQRDLIVCLFRIGNITAKIGGNDNITQAQEFLRTGLKVADQYPGPERQQLLDLLNRALQKIAHQVPSVSATPGTN
jgi:tetratricopeptide (TPR) repeat protein